MNVTQLSLSTEKCVFSATRMHTRTSAMLCTRMAQRGHDADALKCACMPQLENLLNAVITSGPTNKERLYSVNKPLTFSSRCSKATVPCQSGPAPPATAGRQTPTCKTRVRPLRSCRGGRSRPAVRGERHQALVPNEACQSKEQSVTGASMSADALRGMPAPLPRRERASRSRRAAQAARSGSCQRGARRPQHQRRLGASRSRRAGSARRPRRRAPRAAAAPSA